MRDIALTVFISVLLPFALTQPWIGVLLWTWVGLMSPHRLTWDFAYDFPFAMIIGATTLVGLVLTREKLSLPAKAPVFLLIIFTIWMCITTLVAIDSSAASTQLVKVLKIQVMTLVALLVITEKKRIVYMIWVIVASLGFYGVKGGLFTVAHGGRNQVLGPEGSFISGNTEIGLALIMILPLMRCLQLNSENRWIRWGLGGAMALTGLAILGTASRGAFLGAAAMVLFLWLKGRSKFGFLVVLLVAVPLALSFMSTEWRQRMDTISNYQEDSSAMGRIYAWEFATRMAISRPLTGGGFESFTPQNFAVYAPDLPVRSTSGAVPDAHSIYFQVLGHHGFLGLFLYLLLLASIWMTARDVLNRARNKADLRWTYDAAAMIQVSLVGFMAAGAFLGLAYFDLTYTLLVIAVAIQRFVAQDAKNRLQGRPVASGVVDIKATG